MRNEKVCASMETEPQPLAIRASNTPLDCRGHLIVVTLSLVMMESLSMFYMGES